MTDPNFHASFVSGRTLLLRRAAHNLIFFLFSAKSICLGPPTSTCADFGTITAEPYCQRACFEGTKKPIGWFYRSNHRDRRSVSRPPSVVATGGTYSDPETRVNSFCDVFWKIFATALQVAGKKMISKKSNITNSLSIRPLRQSLRHLPLVLERSSINHRP